MSREVTFSVLSFKLWCYTLRHTSYVVCLGILLKSLTGQTLLCFETLQVVFLGYPDTVRPPRRELVRCKKCSVEECGPTSFSLFEQSAGLWKTVEGRWRKTNAKVSRKKHMMSEVGFA